jgi:hypothetical protein
MAVISYPSESRSNQPMTYRIQERRVPGPWQLSRIDMEMPNRDAAIQAAQARCQNNYDLFVRVVDRDGKVQWTNETPDGLPIESHP